MADPLDECGFSQCANLRNQRFARLSLGAIEPDFQQFMMIKGQQNFMHHRRGQTMMTDDDDRFLGMSQRFQITFLQIGECDHKSDYVG